jgi:hypothetical protein
VTVRDVVERCILVSPPAALSEADYAEAAAELEGVLAAVPEVMSIYATGRVANPGISDLDRIAVAKTPVTTDGWARVSQRTRTVAMHGPFLVDRATFERHRWFAHLEPLELVHGEAVAVEEPGERALLGRLLAVEGLVIALMNLHKQLGTGRMKVRSTLCLLHSLRHSLALSDIPTDDAAHARQLLDDVAGLREEWFSVGTNEAEERMREIVARALVVVPEAISRLPSPASKSAGRSVSSMHLSGPWATFTLVRDAPRPEAPSPPRPTPRPLNRIRRLTEAHWRIRQLNLKVAAPAFDLLVLEAHADRWEPLMKRRVTVSAYREYLGACRGHWSAIGFAPSFVSE